MISLRIADSKKDIKNIHKLYKSAFPRCERKPFNLLLTWAKQGKSTHYIVEDEEKNFYGFMLTINNGDLILLDFFAILPKFRGQRIGSKALKLFMNIYAKKRIVLEVEDTSCNKAKNILTRIKRKAFYIKNGLSVMNYKVSLFKCPMEILTNNTKVDFDEYKSILTSVLFYKAQKNVKLL